MALQPLTSDQYNKIRNLLVTVSGISLADDQTYLVESRLTELAREMGVNSYGELFDQVIANRLKWGPRLIDLMTTNETFWFRDESCWRVLEAKVLPELVQWHKRGASPIRIWSAACSTGQEPYSLAILLDDLCKKQGISGGHQFEIHATDISRQALEQAQLGLYDGFHIKRGLNEAKRGIYFEMNGNKWRIRDEIKSRVKFRNFNLMDDYYSLGKFHLILCRNVVIYFPNEIKRHIYAKMASSLHPNGYFFLGATESLRGYTDAFEMEEQMDSVYYRPKSGLVSLF